MAEREREQPAWGIWFSTASALLVFTGLWLRGPDRAIGGSVLYLAVLAGSGALAAISVGMLVHRHRRRRRSP